MFESGAYLGRLCVLARAFGAPAAPYAAALCQASMIQTGDPLLVPALAQTDDYARAAMAAHHLPDERIDALVACRVRLADLLASRPELCAWIIVDETCLYRPIGSRETLRRQLDALVALADTRRAIIQVLKTTSPTVPLLRVPTTMLSFADGTALARLDLWEPRDGADRWAPAEDYRSVFELLRAAALPPGMSRGALAVAAR